MIGDRVFVSIRDNGTVIEIHEDHFVAESDDGRFVRMKHPAILA